jgi:hypothetical protein
MMMVILTSEDHEDQDKQRLTGRVGPMRRMQEDINDLRRALESLKHEMQTLQKQAAWGGGYRKADYTSGMKAQHGMVDPKSFDVQISDDDLRGLNIAIAPATKGLFK